MPDEKRKAKLGELWDKATEAMKPKEEPAAEEVKEAETPAKGKAAPKAAPALEEKKP
jgi:hypothetical protein